MPKAKTDLEINADQKGKKSTEGKSLEQENPSKSMQGVPASKIGSGTPVPVKVEPPAEDTRISIKFTDNKIDTEALRDDNARRVKVYLKNSMADPAIRKWAGIGGSPETDSLTVKIPPPVAGAMLDIIPFATSMALTKNTGLEMKQVYPLVKWTDADHGALDQQAALLMEKYIPDSWKQYSDVGIFCMTLITLFKMKTAAVAELAQKEIEKIGNAKEPKFISQPSATLVTPTPKPLVVPDKPLTPPPMQGPAGADPSNRSLE